ncbi:MAG: hypothetical protein PHV82_08785, partial [Victivallaceae bacterium]|nr:hypothetical protein [Victivallaceae bacterium]
MGIQNERIREFISSERVDQAIFMNPALAEYFTGMNLMCLEHRDFCPEERSMIFVFGKDSRPFVIYRNPAVPRDFKIDGMDVYPAELMLAEKTDLLTEKLIG